MKKQSLILILLPAFLFSCASVPDRVPYQETPVKKEEEEYRNPRIQKKLVEGSYHFVGATRLIVDGREYKRDCTGTVLAIYAYAGIDLTKDFNLYSGNGVQRLYHTLDSEKLLYNTRVPQPGDIIFWDNTYDRNEDRKWNDPFTHVGMVVIVSDSGEVHYVHFNYRKGVVLEKMNLNDPDTYTKVVDGVSLVVNSPMRMSSQNWTDKWLASHLYRIFGMGYLLSQ